MLSLGKTAKVYDGRHVNSRLRDEVWVARLGALRNVISCAPRREGIS